MWAVFVLCMTKMFCYNSTARRRYSVALPWAEPICPNITNTHFNEFLMLARQDFVSAAAERRPEVEVRVKSSERIMKNNTSYSTVKTTVVNNQSSPTARN